MIIVYLVIFSSPHLSFQQSQYRTSFLCLSLLSLLLLRWLENHLNGRIKDSLHILYCKGKHYHGSMMKVMTTSEKGFLVTWIRLPAVFLNYIQCKQALQSAFSVPLPSKKVGNPSWEGSDCNTIQWIQAQGWCSKILQVSENHLKTHKAIPKIPELS